VPLVPAITATPRMSDAVQGVGADQIGLSVLVKDLRRRRRAGHAIVALSR